MVDLKDLPAREGEALSAADFAFQVGPGGDSASWVNAPAPQRIIVRRRAGEDHNDRVEVIWGRGAITDTWLKVTMKANARTGLARPDVFYFGSLVGESGDAPTPLRVSALDLAATKRTLNTRGAATQSTDFDLDGRVDALDLAMVKRSLGRSLGTFNAPVEPAAISFVSALGAGQRRQMDEGNPLLG